MVNLIIGFSQGMAEASSSGPSEVTKKGRPPKELNMDDVKYLLSLGISRSKVAAVLGVSRQTLYNKVKCSSNPEVFDRYSDISDVHLDSVIRTIKGSHPNDGEVMIAGHLLAQNIRVPRSRLRASIHRVDPDGIAERRSIAIKRRVYHVKKPNEVWHIDGNHKLIRWRLVVHGGIDGYSRTITFLKCHSNNRAATVLSAFCDGVAKYGLPTKVRTDHGGENIDVWRMMIREHEAGERCVIAGSSTHNERIERLWRDVHRSVIITFGNLFRVLEAEEHLNHLNEVDIYCLHYVFLPRINQALSSFAEGWNNHTVSTEHHQMPYQMYLIGMLPDLDDSNSSDSESESEYGSSIDLPANDAVCVPVVHLRLVNSCAMSLHVLMSCPLVMTKESHCFCSLLQYVGTT